ncbi:MAG: hypothetical protein Q9163_002668 [Psora crenata]
MVGEVKSIKALPLAYNEADFENSARKIVFEIYHHWKTDPGPVVIQRFTDGIMNTLLKLTKEVPGRSKIENDKQAVLLRSYGRDSDIMIDREMEVTTHVLLAERGLASPLLARFQNGLLYGFFPGRHAQLPLPTLKTETSNSEEREGGTDQPLGQSRTIWTVMQSWLDALPSKSEEARLQQQRLQAEFDKCFRELTGDRSEDSSDYVLRHCDLLAANVIIPPQDPSTEMANHQDLARKVHFIDFEYSVPCPPAFDLANHFSEWGGYDCDYNMLRTQTTRQRFIERYLEYYTRHESELKKSRNLSMRQLFDDVDRYRGMPGLFWGSFSLIQQEVSEVKFDWQSFADQKLAEFWAWRKEIDGSREQAGEEMPLRERRWRSES